MVTELKGLNLKVQQLNTQNEFCLGEMEHCQRQSDKLKTQLTKKNGKGGNEDGDSRTGDDKYESMVKDV